ncbi:unnamed protein product [Trifolium pratense]|uniref:Uncharacterized protein n=1 Tax=Trifolium pratense TaxID=57577 RepID=A0ACB0JGS8_TRIPR|nr:unnamed protein product [Trifolium pratense]
MASPTSKQEKKLVEFLKEQQEPFILELYLLEKSKSWNSIKNFETPPSNSVINKKHKPFFPFFKVLLTALHHKKKKKKKLFATIKDSNTTIKHANVVDITQEAKNNFAQTTMDQTERFSTASSSTMFYSCSDIDDDDDDDHDHEEEEEDIASCVGNQSQQDTINRKHRQRCIEAALFSSIFQTSKKNYTKQLQEILGHKTKRLLFDCVRELTIKLNRKDCKGSSTEKLGKIIWERTKKWSQRGGNFERNLLNLDYLDSINEWSEYKTEVKDVSFEIADAILECVMKDEIVSEMFETLTPTTQ